MKEVLSSVDGVFRMPLPQADRYGPPVIDGLEDFPNHLLVRGRGNYQATRPRDKIETGYIKDSRRAKTLSSGIFTLFCEHEICIGFQLMREPESPRTHFDILMRRLKKMPRIIIYDNACHLHTYALKRAKKV